MVIGLFFLAPIVVLILEFGLIRLKLLPHSLQHFCDLCGQHSHRKDTCPMAQLLLQPPVNQSGGDNRHGMSTTEPPEAGGTVPPWMLNLDPNLKDVVLAMHGMARSMTPGSSAAVPSDAGASAREQDAVGASLAADAAHAGSGTAVPDISAEGLLAVSVVVDEILKCAAQPRLL